MILEYYFGVLTGVVVTLFKETFTLIALLGLMFYHDWQLSLLSDNNDSYCCYFLKKS